MLFVRKGLCFYLLPRTKRLFLAQVMPSYPAPSRACDDKTPFNSDLNPHRFHSVIMQRVLFNLDYTFLIFIRHGVFKLTPAPLLPARFRSVVIWQAGKKLINEMNQSATVWMGVSSFLSTISKRRQTRYDVYCLVFLFTFFQAAF